MVNPDSALAGLSGTTVGDKYELTRPLGSGGMGCVYQAEQLGLGRSVAVKLLRPDLVKTRFSWFRAEALAASRINHPNAVAIYDFGVTGGGVPYLVMEHLTGRSLTELIGDGAIDIARTVSLGSQILSALDEAHACGVIHCDLTGSNVIVEQLRDGRDLAKVIDFGLARLVDSPTTGATYGTAEYAAPELLLGETISPQTDLYSVGVLLFEMIVGRTPFAGRDRPATLEGHLNEIPPRVDQLVRACPTVLADLVARALSKSPADRPASGRDMMQALLAVTASQTESEAPSRKRATLRFGAPPSRSASPTSRSRRTARLDLHAQPTHPFVGRKHELAELERLLREPPAVVQLIGASGMGKARLIFEAVHRLELCDAVFVGGADPTGLKTPWYPILTALEAVFEGRRIETADDLKRAIARAGLRERELPGLSEIFGIPGPAQSLEREARHRESIAAAVRALSSAQRRTGSAVLCFTDVDRYDVPSRRLVNTLAASVPELGLRLLITAEHDDDGLGGECIELTGLPAADAARLTAVLTCKKPPKPVVLAELTQGSPAAIEQLAGWLNMGQLADAPAALVDLISVRVNRLPAPARRVLQAIAVHGSVASYEALDVMLDAGELAALDSIDGTGLVERTRNGFVIPSDTAAAVIAACTPADVRRRLHFRVLDVGARMPFAVRAHHAYYAGELGLALTLFMEAGHDGVRRFDDPGAAHWYGMAMTTARHLQGRGLPTADRALVEAGLSLAETLRRSGEHALAGGVLGEIEPVLETDGHRATWLRCSALIVLEQHPKTAERLLEQAIAAAIAAGDQQLIAQNYLELARAQIEAGELSRATEELEQAIELLTGGAGLENATRPRRLWRLAITLAETQVNLGFTDRAETIARGALAFATRLGSARAKARVSALLALICDQTGQHAESLALRASALENFRRLGDRRSTAELLIERVAIDGDTESASQARALSEEIGWDTGVERAQQWFDDSAPS